MNGGRSPDWVYTSEGGESCDHLTAPISTLDYTRICFDATAHTSAARYLDVSQFPKGHPVTRDFSRTTKKFGQALRRIATILVLDVSEFRKDLLVTGEV